MEGMYNMRSPAVKRLMKEAQELREPTEQYEVHPLEDNLFEWHFTIRGPADSDFDGGLYHGRIILPPDYPMKPPSILLLTHNGRFEVNRKICLSISGHHPESWQPSWSIRTALLAIIGFMPTHGAGALGSLDYPTEERKKLAKRSNDYKCPACGCINNILKPVTEESKKTTEEAKELASQIDFKDEKEKNAALKSGGNPESVNSTTANNVTTEETNIPSQPQNIPPQFSPPPFGQFPFRMPFVPPFPMNPQQQTAITNLSQVPRFPLPYTAPLIPPFPPMMHPGNFQMPPMMPPGMAVPPWQQGGMGMTNPSPPQSAPQPTEDQNSRDTTLPNTTSETSTPSVNTVSDYSLASNAGNTQTESSEDIVSADSTDMPSATATSSTNESVAQTTPEGVRQRNTTSTTTAPSTTPTPTPRIFQEAHISQANRQSESPAFLLFAVIIIAIITLLLFRRLYSMKYFSLLF